MTRTAEESPDAPGDDQQVWGGVQLCIHIRGRKEFKHRDLF